MSEAAPRFYCYWLRVRVLSRPRVAALLLVSCAVLGRLGVPALAAAEPPGGISAQDKATAREAAKRGIEEYRAGQYASALALLERAQALYAAPPHLLYIARCRRQLGQWVEAAELFRSLGLAESDASEPPAFARAIAQARAELAELDPEIPQLVTRVQPSGQPGLDVTLDGVPYPLEALGLARPTNPGAHQLEVRLPGFVTHQAELTLQPKTRTEHVVVLERLPEKATTALSPERVAPPTPSTPSTPSTPKPRPVLGLGLRAGLAFPAGTLPAEVAAPMESTSRRVASLFGAGLQLSLVAALEWPIRWWGLHRLGFNLFVEGNGFRAKSGYQPFASRGFETEPAEPELRTAGISLVVGSARHVTGAFGELGVVVDQRLAFKHRSTNYCGTQPGDLSIAASGAGLRLVGGVNTPLASWFRVQPYAALTLGFEPSKVTYSPNECLSSGGALGDLGERTRNLPSGNGGGVVVFALGLGGEFGISL